MDIRREIFKLTPLGRADQELRDHLGEQADSDLFRKYEKSLNYYRTAKFSQTIVKALLYASLITSVIATFGFEQVQLLQQIASYIGATILIILYAFTSYYSLLRRESYHVKREILLANTEN